MHYPLNDPLVFFFCEASYTEEGDLQRQPRGEMKLWGFLKRCSPIQEMTLTSQGKKARTHTRNVLRERFDIIIRTAKFAYTIEKILWRERWLTPLSEPQFLGQNTGYTLVQTTTLGKGQGDV